MLDRLDAALAKAGCKRGKDFEIIVTPPVTMADGNVPKYAELGVDQFLSNAIALPVRGRGACSRA